ncbi:hypothetical protein [Pseudomonas juntendi]|uniref:Uncharacterized protein n=1 Tax=Pseudomonas juntendi TaxID=2666183 RepID=A0A7W2QYL5_9PSED|nr:hypothetical protein [Pseudomonas juntendi]MBA6134543.1 hypothetical protein [Pseudomonas juntendi]MBA6147642.1 hypothetical protein [Pseudomonas juntendi]
MSYKDRFSEACKIADFAANPIAISGYDVWNVQCVQSGRHVDVDGPFFTEDEARISADLLRGSYRGVKAVSACHCAAWNPDPAREKAIRIQGLQSREMLARRLGVHLPIPKENP